MACSALGDGPSGFSLEASFTEPEIPSSRSTSSIGLPGEYGMRPERYGEARSSSGTGQRDTSRSGRGRITRSPPRARAAA